MERSAVEQVSEADRVRAIVEKMLGEGFAPALLVFVAVDGTTRSVFRDGVELEELLRFVLASECPQRPLH